MDAPKKKHFKCAHPRSPENLIRVGAVRQCRECRDAMNARRRHRTALRNAAIVDGFQSGLSLQMLAERHTVSRSTIGRALRSAGIYRYKMALAGMPFAERALKVAAELGGANVKQIRLDWRTPKQLVRARWAFMAVMRRRGASFPQIGKFIERDHSTVIYGVERAEWLAKRNPEFASWIAEVEAA